LEIFLQTPLVNTIGKYIGNQFIGGQSNIGNWPNIGEKLLKMLASVSISTK